MKFRIEHISESSQFPYVFARQLDSGDFRVTDHSRLGNVGIKPHISQPRSLNENGEIDLTIFAFQPLESKELEKLSLGQIVELEE